MKECDLLFRYQPHTPQQDLWFRQLETACNAHDQVLRCHPLASMPHGDPEQAFSETAHSLPIRESCLTGLRKVIFARLATLIDEGHGREAMDLVAGWRAMPPAEASEPASSCLPGAIDSPRPWPIPEPYRQFTFQLSLCKAVLQHIEAGAGDASVTTAAREADDVGYHTLDGWLLVMAREHAQSGLRRVLIARYGELLRAGYQYYADQALHAP